MLLTLWHLGARRGEVFRLQWDDVYFEKRRIRLSTRKRQDGTLEYDWLPMTHELSESLSRWKRKGMFPFQANVFGQVMSYGISETTHGEPLTERNQFMNGLCKKAGVALRVSQCTPPDSVNTVCDGPTCEYYPNGARHKSHKRCSI